MWWMFDMVDAEGFKMAGGLVLIPSCRRGCFFEVVLRVDHSLVCWLLVVEVP
jgi:hypothetical protein